MLDRVSGGELTGLHEIPTAPGLAVAPIHADVVGRVRAIQGAATAYWTSCTLDEALTRIDEAPPSLVVVAPEQPAEAVGMVKDLRRLWQRQLVPLLLVLPAADETIEAEAYSAGVDFVVTPAVPELVARARAKALLRMRRVTSLLVDSRQRAKGRLERQAESFQMLVEEMRDPLSLLGAGLQGLRGAEGLGEEDRALCDLLAHELRRLWAMAADLVDLQKLEHGELAVRRGPLDAAALVSRTVAGLGGAARGRNLTLALTAPRGSIALEADGELLSRGIESLLAHAMRSSHPGATIEIELETSRAALVVRVTHVAPAVEVAGARPDLAFCRAVAVAHGGVLRTTELPRFARHEITLPR
jgi:signal transduction histidine kinase